MRKLSWLTVGLVLVASAGCADSHEEATADMVAAMKEMNDVLESVEDAESAAAAQAELEDIAQEMQAIQKRMEALDKPTEDQKKALQDEYGPAMAREGIRLIGNMMRVQSEPDVSEKLNDVLRDLH